MLPYLMIIFIWFQLKSNIHNLSTFLYFVDYNLVPTDTWCNSSTSKTSVSLWCNWGQNNTQYSCLVHAENHNNTTIPWTWNVIYWTHTKNKLLVATQSPWLVMEIVSVFILYIINCLRNQYDYITSQVLVNWCVATIFTHNPTATSSLFLI